MMFEVEIDTVFATTVMPRLPR